VAQRRAARRFALDQPIRVSDPACNLALNPESGMAQLVRSRRFVIREGRWPSFPLPEIVDFHHGNLFGN